MSTPKRCTICRREAQPGFDFCEDCRNEVFDDLGLAKKDHSGTIIGIVVAIIIIIACYFSYLYAIAQ